MRLCGGGEWRRTKKEPEESQGRACQVWGSEAWHEMALPKARGGSSLYKPGELTERGRHVDEPRGHRVTPGPEIPQVLPLCWRREEKIG